MVSIQNKTLNKIQNSQNVTYSNCNLKGCTFTGRFQNVEFFRCDLSYGQFTEASLHNCKFIQCKLYQCKVNHSKWYKVMIAGCTGSVNKKSSNWNKVVTDSSEMRMIR